MKIKKKNTVVTSSVAAEAYVPTAADFEFIGDNADISIDSNYAALGYWHEAFLRFVNKKSAMIGLIFIVLITIFAIVGPHMNEYTYSAQNLSEKNLAPRVPVLEYTGIFEGKNLVFVVVQ